ncbi:hypothetical protein NPIL_544951 [Nephila pilipes]|uniref:Uncharacterized protein n=1 Tax=Nephila pilipes TaxID=299642 RepID=A0A8X6PZ22_NEPPI|nr:hypothetical protein NPIL_544951 [Nephila pilipes]
MIIGTPRLVTIRDLSSTYSTDLLCRLISFSSRYHYQQLIGQVKADETRQEKEMHLRQIRAKCDSVTGPEQSNHTHQNRYEGRKGKVVVEGVHTFHDVTVDAKQAQKLIFWPAAVV